VTSRFSKPPETRLLEKLQRSWPIARRQVEEPARACSRLGAELFEEALDFKLLDVANRLAVDPRKAAVPPCSRPCLMEEGVVATHHARSLPTPAKARHSRLPEGGCVAPARPRR
jgi:hypothetical protein